MKTLILGVNGTLGHVLFSEASKYGETRGTCRGKRLPSNVYENIQADDLPAIAQIVDEFKPDLVINCIGLIKQLKEANDPLLSIKINSLFPHELSRIVTESKSHLIHFSTDCVFRGDRGNYGDGDISDATDLYGRTKYLGEVGGERCLTLRTSIIGHELDSYLSLIDWFLSQRDYCKGFDKAIYSGFPTIVLADCIFNKIFPAMKNHGLHGVYNFSSEPISKYDLLRLVGEVYGKRIEIIRDSSFIVERSLNSDKLRDLLNFSPESWPQMIRKMHQHFLLSHFYQHKTEYFF